ncbi:MAG: radical SAM protein [Pirellulales bacterium]|nr:radical SAM protein [Pirellulales bacterium]
MKTSERLQAAGALARLLLRLPPATTWFLLRRMKNTKRRWHRGLAYLNTFYPPYPSKAFDRFCGHLTHRRRLPVSVYMATTPHCPCKCAHCSYAHRDVREMSAEQMLGAVRQVRELGACIIGFSGGEPLLRRQLADWIAEVSEDTATLIFTTGHGLTPRRAHELAEAGLTAAVVGLDSSDPRQHDAVRRSPGSFDHARRAIEACHAAGIYTSVSTIGFAEKLESGELERIYDLCRRWGVAELRVPNPVPTGGFAGRTEALLNAETRRRLYDFHVEHNRRRDDGGPTVTCFAYIESEELFGCGAAYHHLFVDAAGEISPCDVTPLSFGNLNQRPLREIWDELGRYFARPRCRCVMAEIGSQLSGDDPLPLPPEKSRALVTPATDATPLPKGYRALLKGVPCRVAPTPSAAGGDGTGPCGGAAPHRLRGDSADGQTGSVATPVGFDPTELPDVGCPRDAW